MRSASSRISPTLAVGGPGRSWGDDRLDEALPRSEPAAPAPAGTAAARLEPDSPAR